MKFREKNTCFCFSIDGLDEYDGDYEVVDTLSRLARNNHIKICLRADRGTNSTSLLT